MRCFVTIAALAVLTNSAIAQPASNPVLTSLPESVFTVTNFYKQAIYDTADHKIGEVSDALVDEQGKVIVVIVGVGGFLGIGEKDVAVPFSAIRATRKDNKWHLVMNTTKDVLRNAPAFKYDKTNARWVPVKK